MSELRHVPKRVHLPKRWGERSVGGTPCPLTAAKRRRMDSRSGRMCRFATTSCISRRQATTDPPGKVLLDEEPSIYKPEKSLGTSRWTRPVIESARCMIPWFHCLGGVNPLRVQSKRRIGTSQATIQTYPKRCRGARSWSSVVLRTLDSVILVMHLPVVGSYDSRRKRMSYRPAGRDCCSMPAARIPTSFFGVPFRARVVALGNGRT